LGVFQNRVLRRRHGPKKEEVEGGRRRLHNKEVHNLNPLQNIISVIKSRRMRWMGHVARMGYMRKAYNIFVGKPDGKRPLGRRGRR